MKKFILIFLSLIIISSCSTLSIEERVVGDNFTLEYVSSEFHQRFNGTFPRSSDDRFLFLEVDFTNSLPEKIITDRAYLTVGNVTYQSLNNFIMDANERSYEIFVFEVDKRLVNNDWFGILTYRNYNIAFWG